MKKNCWEVKNCGREPGGAKAGDLGICPATTETRLHGVHGGKNAGRSCWVVSDTICKDKPQGTFAQKFKICEQCEFYQQVRQDEFPKFYLLSLLLPKIRGNSQVNNHLEQISSLVLENGPS